MITPALRIAWWAGLAAAAVAAAAEPPAFPAAEGTQLVAVLETAPLALVGQVVERAALDRHGWRATLVVESVLVGEATSGARVPIAWEELATTRPPRFAEGDRVLVALEPLTSGSIWRKRFPDPVEYVRVRAIAQRGSGFLRSPSLGSLAQLGHYLALPRGERAGPAGQGHLLALAADGEHALAVSAAARLAELGGAALEPGRAALALRALARAEGDEALAAGLLAWVERGQPDGLAPRLDQALTEDPRPPATWVRARGLLPGGVGAERSAALFADASPARRAAAASVANAGQRDRLVVLAQGDPAAEVRSAALRRLAQLEGPGALETLLRAFSDREASVRSDAAHLAAELGADAVPRMREVALAWPSPAPETAITALRWSNVPEAVEALRELADAHPDPGIRSLAALAIGRPLGDAH